MKKLLIILFSIMLLLSSCGKTGSSQKTPDNSNAPESSSPPAQAQLRVSDYFPYTKDVHIKYKGTGNEFAEHDTYVEYVNGNILQMRDINPGTSSVIVYELGGGMLKKVYTQHELYYRYDFTSVRRDEEILIKEPIKVGTEWTLKDGSKRTITAIDKNISSPLGNYSALEITTEMPNSIIRDYYAKNTGIVKTIFSPKNSSDIVTSEIEKLEEGVPFKHYVRFYFPDVVNDKMFYSDRIVEINTNQDMKYKFQKELKTIPAGKNLSKVLTPNVQVLGGAVDEVNKIVTVNFSSDLVSEMNAGSGTESMIIKCIVNTFGGYYQVDKVIITIEGKPYSSGHILMKPGEYFKVDTSKAVPYKE